MTTQLTLTKSQTYLKSALFIAANIALPHFFHLFPGGGVMFLPIYFFTVIAAIRYGWQMALLTAVMSPLVGNLLFGAPAVGMLADMVLKGAVISAVASVATVRWGNSLWVCALSVVASWALVGLMEWPVMGSAYAFQDFATGWPGMIMMTLGGLLANLNMSSK